MRAAFDAAARAAAGRRRFRPELWPTFFAAVGAALLVSLGLWQVERLAWKEELIARASARLSAPAEPLPAGHLDAAALDFRRLVARGTYLHDRALAFGLGARDGQPGAQLVTPLALDDGRTLLVDRGWLPTALLPPNVPAALETEGVVEVTGVARDRSAARRGPFQPADDPGRGRWFAWDIPEMGRAVGRPLLPLVLVADPARPPAPLPRAAPVAVDLRNNHLGYALTWFGLAAGLLGVYVAFSLRQPDPKHGTAPP